MKRYAFALAVILLAAAGCSKSNPENSTAPAAATPTAATPAGNACDRKLITQEDVAGLLSEPINSVGPIPGDPQACKFKTAGFSSVSVTLRPGVGDVTVKTWLSGQMGSATPLEGVGDQAAWSSVLKEVNATKNNLLCDIGAIGPATGPATKEKLGALCNKIFAAK